MRQKPLRIAIDLDDTVFKWREAHEAFFHCSLSNTPDAQITQQVDSLKRNRDFWSRLELLERPDFRPAGAVSRRTCYKSYSIACMKLHGMPVVPVTHIPDQITNKATAMQNYDVLIDDSWFNVQQCLSVGVPALLITRPHNAHIDTPYRVNHLHYAEIEQKYNELFR